jgi:hypothetical protein
MTSSPRSTSVDSDPPHSMRRYKRVDQELISPSSLPLQVRREGDSYVGFITPLVALYVTSTYAASLYSPKLFLGWFQHGVVFAVLSLLIYRLCPPKWWELIEVDDEGVTYERFGVTWPERWRVPLSHYRGVVPVNRVISSAQGPVVSERGVALKHPDPHKTLILYLSPAPPTDHLTICAEALGVRPLSDPRYTLTLHA